MTFEDLCILVYYPCCAGGKFIINSLGLSKYCVLHDPWLAQWELEQTDVNVLYNKKLETVLKTVPKNAFDGTWQQYELGVMNRWLSRENCTITSELQKIINSSKHFCLIYHEFYEVEKLLSVYPNTRVVKLTNYIEWMVLCKTKARITDIDAKKNHWSFVDKNEVISPVVDWTLIDIDNSIKLMTKMQQQIETLYDELRFDDFNESRWRQYYTKYARSHGIQVLEN